MRSLSFLCLLLLISSCGPYADLPSAQKDTGQLIVALEARARRGVTRGLEEGFKYNEVKGKGNEKNFAKVNYKKLPNIAVWLEGGDLKKVAIAKKHVELNVTNEGPDHRLLVVTVGGHLKMTNKSSKQICLYSQDGKSSFEANLHSNSQGTVQLRKVGVHHLYCEYNENLNVTLVVTPNDFAKLGEGGSFVFFDELPPGEYTLKVKAPRLPIWSKKIEVTAGQRLLSEASLGVRQIAKSKK